jgi:beta-glucosidase
MINETSQPVYKFQNPDAPIEERVDDIISQLTLEEKIACLGTNPSVPRLNIKASGHIEGLHGVAMGVPGGWGGKSPVPTTTFPQSIGLGQTWDVNVIRRAAQIEGYEARYLFQSAQYQRGGIVVRAPNADLGRDPRWGRTEECFGEDAYFNGEMTAAFVEGLQGDHPKYWQAASLMKHFLANSNEDGREYTSSNFDSRLFREYYSAAFQKGIEAGSRAFMAAYNAYNGIACAVHPMLREIAHDEWGQDGIICTDGGAMKLLVTAHKAFDNFPAATAAVVKAGIGQFLDDHTQPTRDALASGILTEDDIDAALRGNFRVMIRLGLLDPPDRVPYSSIGAAGETEPWLNKEAHEFVLDATRKSIVLLKNTDGLLPLRRESLKSVAVVGPLADKVHLDWYSGSPPYEITPLLGLKRALGEHVDVRYAGGSDIEAAVAEAGKCDAVIVCVGNVPIGAGEWAKVNSPDEGREAVDRQSIELPPQQLDLIQCVLAANPRTILVLVSSFPYAIVWENKHVPAILQMTHNSQEQGAALADVILGDYNPGGRLVQTWPRSLSQVPTILDYDIRHGHTYQYFRGVPLYAFGYGLSYTTFKYSNIRLQSTSISPCDILNVQFDVTNTGERVGDEVAQMYVRFDTETKDRPEGQLKGFQRISIAPGETRAITMPLGPSRLSCWNEEQHRFVVEPGKVYVSIGGSSDNISLETSFEII